MIIKCQLRPWQKTKQKTKNKQKKKTKPKNLALPERPQRSKQNTESVTSLLFLFVVVVCFVSGPRTFHPSKAYSRKWSSNPR